MKLKNIGSNQVEITLNSGKSAIDKTIVFFSYDTPVCVVKDGKTYKTNKKWSKTTSSHINEYLKGWDTLPVEEKEQNFFDSIIGYVELF